MMTSSAPNPIPPKAESGAEEQERSGWPLPVLVALSFVGSVLVLVLLGWYFAEHEYRRQCGSVCPDWTFIPPLTSEAMFATVRNTVTAAAALGLGVTIILSYRRQRVAEQTLSFTAKTQRLAVKSQSLESDRAARESLDTLHSRYLEIATLLNAKGDLNRITALHALESLTISWRRYDDDREASAALGLLLSTARLANDGRSLQDEEFQYAISQILDRHLKLEAKDPEGWGSLSIDATDCLGIRGIRDWIVDGGTLIASPRQEAHVFVDGLTIRAGTVRLSSTVEPSSDVKQGNIIRNLRMMGGRLEVSATIEDGTAAGTIEKSKLSGGLISLSGYKADMKQRNYFFTDCEFKGTTIGATAGKPDSFDFSRCIFESDPSRSNWLQREERSLTFDRCSARDASGNIVQIENLYDLYKVFRPALVSRGDVDL